MPVEGSVVVITGASSGVGRALVREFATRRTKLGLIARNVEALTVAAEEAGQRGSEALILPADVSDSAAIELAAGQVEDRLGPIDIWINCAMATVFAPVWQTTAEEYRRVTEVTYLGYVHGTQAALQRMRPRNRGHVVQIGSALAYRSIPLQSAYCAAKAAIRAFTDSARTELIHEGSQVKLSMIQLPAVNTPQATRQRNKMEKQAQPVPPMFSPEAIARAIVRAIEEQQREALLGWPVIQAVWAQKLVPGLADKVAAKTWAKQLADQPNQQQADILFAPLAGDPGAHGPYRGREQGPDLAMRLRSNPKPVLALGGAALLTLLAFARKR